MDSERRAFSIRIFLAEGNPSGLKFVEKSNWIGRGVVCPRPRFSTVKARDEFGKAGVYVLVGESSSADIPMVYIGEGDPVRERLEQHHSKKDFWTAAYFFTSKDENLNKAHIQYLEYRLIAIASEAKRCRLDNLNVPAAPSLSDPEKADMEGFLEEMLLCFPVIGVGVFEKPEAKVSTTQVLYLTNKGCDAKGYESQDGFVVKSGSTAVIETVSSLHSHINALRDGLLQDGILRKRDSRFYELLQDYEFTSPSAAADFIVGASINGRDVWKNSKGVTLKELQERAEDK